MLTGLWVSAFLMGLGGMAHCAAMCGMACSVAMPGGVPWSALVGRSVGYAVLGGVAAASAGLIAELGRRVGFLQPFWIMLLVAAVILGLWLMAKGRMPALLDHWGTDLYRRTRARWQAWAQRRQGAWWWPAWPVIAGMLWAFLPCGLLYAALMLASLAPTVWGGATVMLAFSVPSAVGVWAAPWVLNKLTGRAQGRDGALGESSAIAPVLWLRSEPAAALPRDVFSRASTWVNPRWAIRLAGLGMAAMAGWGLAHHMWAQYQAWCA